MFHRFDGKAIVERLRGKRLLFVGDSVNRNQWDSMMCMLHSSIPGKKRVSMGALNGTLYTFRASVSPTFPNKNLIVLRHHVSSLSSYQLRNDTSVDRK